MTPDLTASDGLSAGANDSEQTGKRHQLDVAYLVTNMATNINKTVPGAKWNIKNEDQLVEIWEEREYRLMQDKPKQDRQGEARAETGGVECNR